MMGWCFILSLSVIVHLEFNVSSVSMARMRFGYK